MKNVFKILLIALVLISCKKENKKVVNKNILNKELTYSRPVSLTDSLHNAMGAYFFNNHKTIILNWTEEIDSSGIYKLKFKFFNKNNNSFSKTYSVPPSKGMQSHMESMAKIGLSRKGILYAVFRIENKKSKRRFAGDIFYSVSKDSGRTWSEKKKLVEDKSSRSQSFFDVALLPDGELGISWLDSRKLFKDKDGSTLYFARSKGNQGFIDEKPVAGSTCQCCRTDIYVDSKKNINIAFRNLNDNSIRDMHRVISKDNGKSFAEPVIMGVDNWKIDGCPHTGPSLADNREALSVVWFTGADSGSGIFFKNLDEASNPLYKNKTLITNVGSHPQMVALPGNHFFIVYEEYYKVRMKFLSNIVLHVVNDKGEEIVKKIISLPNTSNNHAVITVIDNNTILVSWVRKQNKHSVIDYSIVSYK